jgi:hypothetical protein
VPALAKLGEIKQPGRSIGRSAEVGSGISAKSNQRGAARASTSGGDASESISAKSNTRVGEPASTATSSPTSTGIRPKSSSAPCPFEFADVAASTTARPSQSRRNQSHTPCSLSSNRESTVPTAVFEFADIVRRASIDDTGLADAAYGCAGADNAGGTLRWLKMLPLSTLTGTGGVSS